MRGLLCFLLLFALTVNMNARPQADTRITLKLDNVTLTKAMNEIKQQSRFLFINKGVDAGKSSASMLRAKPSTTSAKLFSLLSMSLSPSKVTTLSLPMPMSMTRRAAL